MELIQILTRMDKSVRGKSIMYVRDSVANIHVNLAWNNIRNLVANSVSETIIEPLHNSLNDKNK